ncbi:hypothetical protein GCM10010191_38810 [Actinomadura vinacea]|uniref:SMI1/KNR4 family protein n=1 Tax=Actinomadura vinacea TaxID=115336 RepID=A0ABN3J7J0_9ACTN
MGRRRERGSPTATLDPRRFSIAEYREYVLARRQTGPGELAGCSPGEIEHLARVQGVGRIPRLYREFLLAMGKNPRPLLSGVDWTYPDLLQIKGEMTTDLTAAGIDTGFLDDTLLIGLGGGHYMFYIPNASTAGDDPEVWTSSDGGDRERAYPTFREFLLAIADDDGRAVRLP